MTPWEVVEEGLRRKKRSQPWLAEQLGISIAAVGHWKNRGVPPKHSREIARLLGLTQDQLEGAEPPPWEKPAAWPFPDTDLLGRVEKLSRDERVEIQGKLRDLIKDYENQSGNSSGGVRSGSQK